MSRDIVPLWDSIPLWDIVPLWDGITTTLLATLAPGASAGEHPVGLNAPLDGRTRSAGGRIQLRLARGL
jgi:hypothetical protein